MSNTYQRISDASEMPRIVQRHALAEEFVRRPLAAPAPFNIPILFFQIGVFLWRYKEVDAFWPTMTWSDLQEIPDRVLSSLFTLCLFVHPFSCLTLSFAFRMRRLDLFLSRNSNDFDCQSDRPSLECLQFRKPPTTTKQSQIRKENVRDGGIRVEGIVVVGSEG